MEDESNSSVKTLETVETHNAQMLPNKDIDNQEKNVKDSGAKGSSSRDMLSNLKKKKEAEKQAAN